MTDTPRPTAGGLTWDQCLSVAYEGCAEVLAKRVQELERERGLLREGNLASVEQACAAAWKAEDVSEAGPQGIAGGNTHDETVDACPTCVASALRDAADVAREHCTNPLAGDEPCEVSCDCCAIAARLDALAQEVERG